MKLIYIFLYICLLLYKNNSLIKNFTANEFKNILIIEKNNRKKKNILNNILYPNDTNFQNDIYINTKKDFVLYIYAKWDIDSNNLITVFREVARIINEKKIDISFYILNIENIKDLCNMLNIKTLPLIFYISSTHKKSYNSFFYKFLNTNNDVKISNAFRYNGDNYCYDNIIDWIEIHYYFTKFILYMKKLYFWK